jgi:hypothetical protein
LDVTCWEVAVMPLVVEQGTGTADQRCTIYESDGALTKMSTTVLVHKTLSICTGINPILVTSSRATVSLNPLVLLPNGQIVCLPIALDTQVHMLFCTSVAMKFYQMDQNFSRGKCICPFVAFATIHNRNIFEACSTLSLLR